MNFPRGPLIWLYSLVFPATWIVFGLIFHALFASKQAGMIGAFVVIYAAVILICWLFVRRHVRHFTNTEYWWLIAYCTAWAWFLESLALISFLMQSSYGPNALRGPKLLLVVSLTYPLDFLFIWLGFAKKGKPFITSYLEKQRGLVEAQTQ
jgi:purine-cytosine permease-like protein